MTIEKKLKILFVHNNYASNNSGEEHAAEGLASLLEQNGHTIKWYRRSSDNIGNSFFKMVSAFFLGIYNPKSIREMKVLITSFKPDIVQIQNLYPLISPAIINIIRQEGIPVIMRCPNYRLFCPTGLHLDSKGNLCEKCLSFGREIHCVTKNCEKNYFKSVGYALRNFIARKVWGITHKMDAYIVQTQFQKNKFIKNGIPSNKLFIIPGLTPKIHNVDNNIETKYVSFIGRVSEEKGINEFLEAARKLPNIPFMVVGDFQNSSNFKNNSPSNVLWKGFVSGMELDMSFKESKIVVVPGKWFEGFPNVITRAMKHGKPVITSNLGAMASIIDHDINGLLVEPGNSQSLVNAIKVLYFNTTKCELYGKNAKLKAEGSLSSSVVYQNLLKVYYNVIIK